MTIIRFLVIVLLANIIIESFGKDVIISEFDGVNEVPIFRVVVHVPKNQGSVRKTYEKPPCFFSHISVTDNSPGKRADISLKEGNIGSKVIEILFKSLDVDYTASVFLAGVCPKPVRW